MDNFKLSVIIPCHNYGEVLSRCLQSILGQSRRPDEIIIVDDASTDDTAGIAARYARTHNVKYLQVECYSPLLARKAGVEAASGNLVCTIDADDTVDPFYFDNAIKWFGVDRRIAIVYSDVCLQSLDGQLSEYPQSTLEKDISIENYIHSGAVVRRDALIVANAFEHGGPSNRYEDWSTWRKIIEMGFIGVKQDSVYNYIRSDNSISADRHVGHRGYTYFKSAALADETITLFTPLAGRYQVWERYSKFLRRQTWPHDKIKLIIMDTSQDPKFTKMVKEWLLTTDYTDVHYIERQVASRGVADEKRIDEYGEGKIDLLAEVRIAMARIYNELRKLVTTNYVWILEDDIIPPLDVAEDLMRGFCKDTVSICAPYRHRYEDGFLAWQKDAQLLQGGNGFQEIWGNGFGCVIIRSETFKAIPFTYDKLMPDCDKGFYELFGEEKLRKINWDLECDHLSPKYVKPQQRHTKIIFTEENFDEQFYLSRYADVKQSIEEGVTKSGFAHYLQYGKKQGRAARRIEGKPRKLTKRGTSSEEKGQSRH